MRRMLVLGAVVVLAGCGGGGGGGSSESPEDQVRSAVDGFLRDVTAGENGRACERSTEPDKCVQSLVTASGLLGEQSTRDLFKDAKVTSVRMDADERGATIRYTGDDSPSRVVKRGGRWLVVTE